MMFELGSGEGSDENALRYIASTDVLVEKSVPLLLKRFFPPVFDSDDFLAAPNLISYGFRLKDEGIVIKQ